MRKIIIIAFKDLKQTVRDRAALILMILAPFLITFVMGAISGRFPGSTSNGNSSIQVVIVNQDSGHLGQALVETFESKDLNGWVAATLVNDPAAARQRVENHRAAAAVIIPARFSEGFLATQAQPSQLVPDSIELYTDPAAPTSAGVVKTILDNFIGQVKAASVSNQVAATQLVSHGLTQAQQAALIIGAAPAAGDSVIKLDNVTSSGKPLQVDLIAYLAPAMALMFLMYTASNGGRALLAERDQGTLTRLLVSPTRITQLLSGKVLGIFIAGAAQMILLINASTYLFQLKWGDPQAVTVLSLAAVFGAAGWGVLLSVFARTSSDVGRFGIVLTLVFGLFGGSFFDLGTMPGWFQTVSKITPNAWGMQGFVTLALGGTLVDVLTPVLALLVMGAILLTLSVFLFNRRMLMQP